jgi:molybdopterin molybdotransferase
MQFDNILIVDWSGGNDRGKSPKKDAIWSTLIERGTAQAPIYHRNRQVVETYLTALFTQKTAANQTLLAGFDFPFGYPGTFAAQITGSQNPLALWDHYAAHLTDTPVENNRFALANQLNQHFPGTGPFWFNATRQTLPDLPHKGTDRASHGLPEKRLSETMAKGAFTCWQLGGAGAVGSQAITGMASLSRLRAAFPTQIAVWPFEPLTKPITLVEVWPSLYAAEVREGQQAGEIKDAAQTRITAQIIAAAQSNGTLAAQLAAPPERAQKTEGWILGLPSPIHLGKNT